MLASESLLLVGDGEHALVALDPVTGKERWTSEFARLPILATDARLLVTTRTEPAWLELATGAMRELAEPPSTCGVGWACPASPTTPERRCAVAAAGFTSGERTFVAHGSETCHYQEYGPVAAPQWVCEGSTELLEMRGNKLARVDDKDAPAPAPFVACQNQTCMNTATFDGARVEPMGQSPLEFRHTAADGKTRVIRTARDALYRSQRSADGRFIAFSKPGTLLVHPQGLAKAQLTDWSILDIVTGRVTALVGSLQDVDLRFVVVGRTVIVHHLGLSYTEIIPQLAGFDLATGKERWHHILPRPTEHPLPASTSPVDALQPPMQ